MPLSRSFLQTLDKNSAQYVLCHAAWRKSRGKKEATAAYGCIVNPAFALDLAISVIERISRAEELSEKGEKLLSMGKTLANATHQELFAMVHFIAESADDPIAASKLLFGMLEVPPTALFEVRVIDLKEILRQYCEELPEPKKNDKSLEGKVIFPVYRNTSMTQLKELYRSYGGLSTKDGAFITVQIREKGGMQFAF